MWEDDEAPALLDLQEIHQWLLSIGRWLVFVAGTNAELDHHSELDISLHGAVLMAVGINIQTERLENISCASFSGCTFIPNVINMIFFSNKKAIKPLKDFLK